MLVREWRSGELGVLLLALTIAVAALTGVGFLASRINAAVAMQATQVLAADLRLQSAHPIEEADMIRARSAGLRTARATALLSVVFEGDRSQLADIDAVTASYPLRGKVMVANQPFAPGRATTGIPAPGEVWPDSRLLAALGARVGSRLSIGAAEFTVGRVLISRPDEGGTFRGLVPNLLMNAADLPRTQLIQPGSRVSYAALFAGTPGRLQSFRRWLVAHRRAGERLRDVSSASPQIKNAVDRARRFLSLASLVAVLLCATAVAMSARRYVGRHLDTVALMKTLGATRAFTLRLAASQLLAVALLAGTLGSAVGYATQAWLVYALRGVLASGPLPPVTLAPFAMGFLTAGALLAGFALPSLLRLSRIPAIRVLRRDIGAPRPRLLLAFGPAVVVVISLIYWVVLDWKLMLGLTIGLAAFVALLVLAGMALIAAAARLRTRGGGAWRRGVARISRSRADSVVQLVAFGTGIMALVLLGIIRNDLNGEWRRSLPADLPNYFFINIPPQSRGAFLDYLRARGARTSRMLPMIRGRLTAIDGQPVRKMRFADHRGGQFANREQNLTWSAALGADNRVVAGRWWTPAEYGQPLVSISTEFQRWLGLRLGERLTFDIAGQTLTVRVASIRKVKWDSFHPNFFIVFAPGLLDKLAGTYLTSAYLAPAAAESLAHLAHRFPSVSIFDIDDLLADVRSVLDKAILAVQSVFGFTLLAGLTVLLAAVQSSRDERRYESAILRTLGASRRTVLQGVLAEFAVLGVMAGLIAAAGASLAAYWLTRRVLDLPYEFSPWACLAAVLGGGGVVMASGWLATRSVVRQPPLTTLRADV
jgi:putative ABC transport system permease protein